MKTKRIKSKKERIFIILDLLVAAICIYRCRSNIDNTLEVINGIKAFDYNIVMVVLLSIYMLWVFLLYVLFKNVFIIAIYLAYRIPRKRMLKKNSKYEVIDNITYYRERFKDITPSEISLITDLEMELKKDFAATILDLYNRSYIEYQGTILIITNKDTNSLRESERFALDIIKNKMYSRNNLNTWKDMCIKEAINNNLIIDNKPKGFSRLSIVGKWLIVLWFSILAGVAYVATPLFNKTWNDLNKYDELTKDKEEKEIVEMIKTDKEFRDLMYYTYVESIPLMIFGTLIFGSIMALVSMPIYLKARKVTYKLVDSKDRYNRTHEGKILVEQIAGMKNFIHDFSTLSEKEKESVKLWNDFLVYAVVLEENEKIIDDIFRYHSVDIRLVNTINNEVNSIE